MNLKMVAVPSWGNYFSYSHEVSNPAWSSDFSIPSTSSQLAYGLGRSYGDSCLNQDQGLILTSAWNHFLSFNSKTGILRCEAGVSFEEILRLIVPQGWFLPVTPGTKYVTVGGAIANDVHGKNHHIDGCFGNHILQFELLRSNGDRLLCSPQENSELFSATIGGLGLTGLITWAEFKLKPIQSQWMEVELIKLKNLDHFAEVVNESSEDYVYTVTWLDCLAKGKNLGRGIFMRGNHAPAQSSKDLSRRLKFNQKTFPFMAPGFLLNSLTVKAFNFLYYHKQFSSRKKQLVHFDPYFYPLDSLNHWNRIYGRRGFFQHQSVIPKDQGLEPSRKLLEAIAQSGQGSFLTVFKEFGSKQSPGLLSFPQEGTTLALDFSNQGQKTLDLLSSLDEIVLQSGGRVYPAKDSRMSGENFRKFFPQWEEFERYRDPQFSSSFWRRVVGNNSL